MGEETKPNPVPEANPAPPAPEQKKEDTPAQKPEVVSVTDFKKLQSTYDTRLGELTKANEGLQTQLNEVLSELKIAREGLPKDQAEFLKREKDLQTRESKLKTDGDTLAQRARSLKAKELIHNYKPDGLTEADLVKLASESEMELTVLRKITEPKRQNLPAAQQIDQGTRSSGGPLTEREALLSEVEQAKKR